MTKYTTISLMTCTLALSSLFARESCHHCEKNSPLEISITVKAPMHRAELKAFWKACTANACKNMPDEESCECPEDMGCKQYPLDIECGSCSSKTKVDTLDDEEEQQKDAEQETVVETEMSGDDGIAVTISTEVEKTSRQAWLETFARLKKDMDATMQRIKETLSSIFGLTNTVNIKSDEAKKTISYTIIISPATSHTENIPLFVQYLQKEMELTAKSIKKIVAR
ncbi:MAG TPA: hypothetical protein VEK38_00710 [Candidatus Bathyarchaeia archaeon]|nr:hypothetical protein [Candidatus Bathyarchaeia archaeon]